ncbi:hypothetical protein LZ31DRAFT_573558 [Colletotrichum somersetense]|nr:hypothetical protein LZ31DRAFT_573558 [Colletotrichum somersetense]
MFEKKGARVEKQGCVRLALPFSLGEEEVDHLFDFPPHVTVLRTCRYDDIPLPLPLCNRITIDQGGGKLQQPVIYHRRASVHYITVSVTRCLPSGSTAQPFGRNTNIRRADRQTDALGTDSNPPLSSSVHLYPRASAHRSRPPSYPMRSTAQPPPVRRCLSCRLQEGKKEGD